MLKYNIMKEGKAMLRPIGTTQRNYDEQFFRSNGCDSEPQEEEDRTLYGPMGT
jgi:hypothetical protein